MIKTHWKYALRVGVAALALIAHPAFACLNDRDTLALEARRKPEALQAIVGRFERNPPLYYEMRIARIEKDLRAHPGNLDEYDDIAVACDRLGRDDDAIAWMDLKRGRLPPLAMENAALKEDWYKYYANIGTCRVHRWLRAGGDRTKIAEVRRAHDEIAQAVKIKPDAHFGREKYQLRVISWILDSGEAIKSGQTPSSLSFHSTGDDEDGSAVTGLSGLITLGNAWESVDIFSALADSLSREKWELETDVRVNHLQTMALARVQELRHEGKKSLFPEALKLAPQEVSETNVEADLAQFRALRAEADRWQKARTDYIMARLTAGRHPDTDPAFWAEYHGAAPPEIPDPDTEEKKRRALKNSIVGAVFTFVLAAVFVTAIVLLWRALRDDGKRKTAN